MCPPAAVELRAGASRAGGAAPGALGRTGTGAGEREKGMGTAGPGEQSALQPLGLPEPRWDWNAGHGERREQRLLVLQPGGEGRAPNKGAELLPPRFCKKAEQ